MRALAEDLGAYAERLEGAWSVEIGPSGPVLAMVRPPKRHQGTVRRIREQVDAQLLTTHRGYICANGPGIEHPAIARMRRPDAVVIPEAALDEEGLAVDATQVLAVIEIVSPSAPVSGYEEKLADYPAMGIPHCMIVDPRTGTTRAPERSRCIPTRARAATAVRSRTSSATRCRSGRGRWRRRSSGSTAGTVRGGQRVASRLVRGRGLGRG